jgi:hypothetical protein
MPFFTIVRDSQLATIVSVYDKIIDDVLVTAEEILSSELLEGETFIQGTYPQDEYELSEDNEPIQKQDIEPDRFRTPTAEQQINKMLIDARTSGLATQLSLPPMDEWTKSDAKGAIDQAAGRARLRMASDGVFVDVEYVQAGDAVKVWRAAGSPADDIPEELQCWVDASGMTLENAALDIEANSAGFRTLIALIRRKRLIGKAAVDAEPTNYIATAQTYIDQLDAL